jgi:hypothetical protein
MGKRIVHVELYRSDDIFSIIIYVFNLIEHNTWGFFKKFKLEFNENNSNILAVEMVDQKY